MASFLHAADPGPFDLHPLVADRNFKSIKDYWHRFKEQINFRRGPNGYTPLHVAVENGYYEIAEFLLQKDTPVDIRASNNETPLYIAAEHKHTECEILLVAYGANIATKCGPRSESPLTGSDAQFVKLLSSSGASKSLGGDHRSANAELLGRGLVASARLNYLPMVTRFIELGAENINQAIHEAEDLKRHRATALLMLSQAAMNGDTSTVHSLYGESLNSIFVQSGVKEAVSTLDLRLPLQLAKSHGHGSVYDELLVHQGVLGRRGGVEVVWSDLGIECLSGEVLKRIKLVLNLSLARNCLTTLDSTISICTKLSVVDLSHNYLKEVDVSLLELPSLRSLNLSHNFLEDLPIIKNVQKSLTHLDLSSNRLNKVSYTVINFPFLVYLNLSHNFSLCYLPDWLAYLERLDDLRIEGLGSSNVTLTRGGTQETIQFLKHRLQNTKQFREMKMIIVGPCGGGKTKLINHMESNNLNTNRLDHGEGVFINEISQGNSNGYSYNVWEVSGRSLTKSTLEFEQLFYTPHALFLVVFSLKDDLNVIKADVLGRIKAIKKYASPSCVLMVGTHSDMFSRKSDLAKKQLKVEEAVKGICAPYEKSLIFLETKMVTISLSSEPQNIHLLVDAVHRLASKLTCPDGHPFMGRQILLSALGLKGEVESFKRRPDNHPYLTYTAMESLATNLKDIHQRGELQSIFNFLLEAGSFLYFPNVTESSMNIFFVSPNWFFNKVVAVLDLAKTNMTGFVNYASILETLQQLDPVIDDKLVYHLVQVLMSYGILASCKENAWYIVPFLLLTLPPEGVAMDIKEPCYTWQYKLNRSISSHTLIDKVCSVIENSLQLPKSANNELVMYFWSTGFIWRVFSKAFKITWDEANTNVTIAATRDLRSDFEAATEHFQELLDVSYNIEILCPTCTKKSFSMHSCLKAIAEGETQLSCRQILMQHYVDIVDIAPFLFLHISQTCPMSLVQRACRVVKSPQGSSTTYYKDREANIVKYKGLVQKSFRDLHYRSLFLNAFNVPCISNTNGRLLAIALSESKSAALYLTPSAADLDMSKTLKKSPLVSMTLYRMGIELVKALVRLPYSVRCTLDFENIQMWSTHSSSLIHCSIAVPDSKIRECCTAEINDTELKSHWYSLMEQVRKNLFSHLKTPPHYLKKILAVCATPSRIVSIDSLLEALSSQYVQQVSAVKAPHTLVSCPIYCHVPDTRAVWTCGQNPESKMIDLSIIDLPSLKSSPANIKPFQIDEALAMCVTNDAVWVSTSTPDDMGCISIFDSKAKTLVHNIKMKQNYITCMTVMHDKVCMGTKAGFLLMFSNIVDRIKQGAQPRTKFICEEEITGLAVVGDHLWIAHSHYIYYFDIETRSFEGSTYSNDATPIGRLYCSADGSVIHSAKVGGTLLLAWSPTDGQCLYSVDVTKLSLESVEKPSRLSIASVAPILDSVWIGLSSGHIVVADNKDGSVISTLHPHGGDVSMLCPIKPSIDSATPYYNILSWGHGHIPPLDNFFTVPDEFSQGVLLLWDAYSCRTLLQMSVVEKSCGSYLDSYDNASDIAMRHGFVGRGMIVPSITDAQHTPTTEHSIIDLFESEYEDCLDEGGVIASNAGSMVIDTRLLRRNELVESCQVPSLAKSPPTDMPNGDHPTTVEPDTAMLHHAYGESVVDVPVYSDELEDVILLTLSVPATLTSLHNAIHSHPQLSRVTHSDMGYRWQDDDLLVSVSSEDEFVCFLSLSPRPLLHLTA